MARYIQGSASVTKRGERLKSIIDIELQDKIILSVFPGELSENDILLLYKDLSGRTKSQRYRTPKHIHWAVDLMLKREHNQKLTVELLQDFKNQWAKTKPLSERNSRAVYDSLVLSRDEKLLQKYKPLNLYGYYNTDFIIHLMELLMLQEKTNYPSAYMFLRVISELISGNDLFKVISTATLR